MLGFLKTRTGVLILLVMVGAFLLGAYEGSKTPEQRKLEAEQQAQKDCSDPVMAFVQANHFIGLRLKSPTTADFPYINYDGVRTNYLGNCTHEVWTYVDAQNSFGAMIRDHYYVRLQKIIAFIPLT